MKKHESFADYDWRKVVSGLVGKHRGDARIIRESTDPAEIEVYVPGFGRVIIADNGGELNISSIKPIVKGSVPYTDVRKDVGEYTLASRINQAIHGEHINYDVDMDADTGGKRRHAKKPRRKKSLATLMRQAKLARAVRKLIK